MASKKYLSGLIAALSVLTTLLAHAETTELTHQVVPGESLYIIAQRYLESAEQWRVLQRINKVADPIHLQPGTLIKLPAELLKRPAVATILTVTGMVVRLADGNDAPSVPVTAGMAVPEGERLKVAENSFVSIRLADGSVVRVAADSEVQLQRLRNNKAGATQSILRLNRGSAEAEVQPQKKPNQRFEIHTPIAVASVRGTRFDVHSLANGQSAVSVETGVVVLQKKQPTRLSSSAKSGIQLTANEGAPVYANGQLGIKRALLAEPDLATLPAVFEDSDALDFTLARPSGVAAYQIRIAADDTNKAVLRNNEFPLPQAQSVNQPVGNVGSNLSSVPIRFAQLEDGDYILAARAVDVDGVIGREATRKIVINTQPVAPLYQQPLTGSQIDTDSGELVCTEVVRADAYHLQISSREDFAHPEVDEPRLATCRYSVNGLKPGAYFWRVASVSLHPVKGPTASAATQSPKQGPYAKPQRFVLVERPKPPEITLQDGTETATLFWHTEAGQSFRLQLALDQNFSQVITDQALTHSTWNAEALDQGDYFVRIQTRNADGLTSPFSPPRRLRIRSIIRSDYGPSIITSDGQPVTRTQP